MYTVSWTDTSCWACQHMNKSADNMTFFVTSWWHMLLLRYTIFFIYKHVFVCLGVAGVRTRVLFALLVSQSLWCLRYKVFILWQCKWCVTKNKDVHILNNVTIFYTCYSVVVNKSKCIAIVFMYVCLIVNITNDKQICLSLNNFMLYSVLFYSVLFCSVL